MKRPKKTTDKFDKSTGRDKSKDVGKNGDPKDFGNRSSNTNKNRISKNNERKFFRQVGGEYTRTKQKPDAKETKQFRGKIWEKKT